MSDTAEGCYPQRPMPPKSKAEEAKVQTGRGPAAAKKQGSDHN